MIGKYRNVRFGAIRWHGETECSFRGKREIRVFHCERCSSEKLRWAVASIGEEKCHPEHPTFLTDGTGRDINPADSKQLFLPGLLPEVFFDEGFGTAEDLTACGDVVLAGSVGQQAEMTYPDIARRQYMEKESPDKFIGLQRHGFLTVTVGVISPEKRNMAVPDSKDAVIADGDSMGIPAEILKDPPGAIEGWFAIDNPLLLIELSPERFEGSGFLEMADFTGEYKIIRREAFFEPIQELPSEQRRDDPHGHKEAFAA
jgi:hypothetical protein